MFCTKEGVERRKGVTVCMISMMYQMKTSAKAFVTHCTIAVWAMNGMVAVKLIQLQLPTEVEKVALNAIFGQVTIIMHFCRSND